MTKEKRIYLKNYHNWLHELTTIGYTKGIMWPVELNAEIIKLFNNTTEPKKAVNVLIGIAHFKGISICK